MEMEEREERREKRNGWKGKSGGGGGRKGVRREEGRGLGGKKEGSIRQAYLINPMSQQSQPIGNHHSHPSLHPLQHTAQE